MIKRALIILLTLIMFASLTQALEVEKIDKGSTIISEVSEPAVFDFVITNAGQEGNFEIYSLTVPITPTNKIKLKTGDNVVEIRANPTEELRKNLGYFTFQYEIKGPQTLFKDSLLLKIVQLSDVLEVNPSPILPNDNIAEVKIKNTQNANLKNVQIKLDSPFFTEKQTLNFAPNEEKTLNIDVNKDAKKLSAGNYIVKAEIEIEKAKTEEHGTIEYLEKEGNSFEKNTEGFIIRKTIITKTNVGNTDIPATINFKKGIIGRLFTLNSPSVTKIERQGLSVIYVWNKNLSPGETLQVESTTNYTIPFLILILIIVIGIIAQLYYFTALAINKKVSFVRTKGGELALKVTLHVKARRHIDKIQLIDTLPGMTKLYEKFGKAPDRIDENSRRLFWNISSLNAGEERVFSYIIYSKLKVVGRFELPSATAIFSHEGTTKEAWSNKAFFATEIGKSD